MKFSFANQLSAGFAIAVVILALATIFSIQSTNRLSAVTLAVQQAEETLTTCAGYRRHPLVV
jgi:CHASE3 domain sensor protein